MKKPLIEFAIETPQEHAGRNMFVQHHRVAHSPVSNFATGIALMLGRTTVCARETATGHPVYRPLTAVEIVEKTISVTTMLFDRFEELGWTVEAPAYESLRPEPRGNTGFHQPRRTAE